MPFRDYLFNADLELLGIKFYLLKTNTAYCIKWITKKVTFMQ